MKSVAVQAEIKGKKLVNHSTRQMLVKKLKAANQPFSAIIGVAGHTNERSLANYEEGYENEQRLTSSMISSDGQASTSNRRSPLKRLMMNEDPIMTINNFHDSQVTINYQLSQKLAEPKSNAPDIQVQFGITVENYLCDTFNMFNHVVVKPNISRVPK